MSITEREMILRPIHDEAENEYRRNGWQDDPYPVWLHAFTAERLVQELIHERRRCRVLEDSVVRLERRLAG